MYKILFIIEGKHYIEELYHDRVSKTSISSTVVDKETYAVNSDVNIKITSDAHAHNLLSMIHKMRVDNDFMYAAYDKDAEYEDKKTGVLVRGAKWTPTKVTSIRTAIKDGEDGEYLIMNMVRVLEKNVVDADIVGWNLDKMGL